MESAASKLSIIMWTHAILLIAFCGRHAEYTILWKQSKENLHDCRNVSFYDIENVSGMTQYLGQYYPASLPYEELQNFI